jgi:choline dehydrogenase-like flavoprotein
MSTNGVNGHASADVLPALALNADDFLKHEYDFIIVGGGTAGLAVAARLTENPDVTVGVLEAGKNRLDDFLVDTPGVFTQLLGNDEYDWKFMTVPQVNGREYHIPRGKLLGGSSGINYMMYVRGSTQDYDDWAILADDPSWGSDKMNQYMRKHQTLDPVDEAVVHRSAMPYVDKNHGTSGPVHTSFNDFFLPIEDDFQKAFDEVTGIDKKPVDPYV